MIRDLFFNHPVTEQMLDAMTIRERQVIDRCVKLSMVLPVDWRTVYYAWKNPARIASGIPIRRFILLQHSAGLM